MFFITVQSDRFSSLILNILQTEIGSPIAQLLLLLNGSRRVFLLLYFYVFQLVETKVSDYLFFFHLNLQILLLIVIS